MRFAERFWARQKPAQDEKTSSNVQTAAAIAISTSPTIAGRCQT
jgi:hypothetical protein